MPTVTPHLWYDNEALEAAERYCSIFPDSRILNKQVYDNTGPDGEQTVLVVEFTVCGQKVIGLNAGPEFKFNESFSFYVECEGQEEVDRYWDALIADGGQESQCGWLKDRYGLSWQIIPKLLTDLLSDEDPAKSKAVMHAMLQMQKIDCAKLQEAYDNPVGANA